MTRTVEVTLYQFDELSESAKGKAREWYRHASADDSFWSEYVIEDAKTIGAMLGFDIDQIYFSGFWSQGDGACFTGIWRASEVGAAGLKDRASLDANLHSIADALASLAAIEPDASARIQHNGHYYHSGCTRFEAEFPRHEDVLGRCAYKSARYVKWAARADEAEQSLKDTARLFMDWIYSSLEREWEYQNADEQVDESIRINGYEFDEEGVRT